MAKAPKGRTSAPLTIWVAPEFQTRPEVAELQAAGHTILYLGGGSVDLILSPAAHQWNEYMAVEETRKDGTTYRPYLVAAITAARKRKREAK